MREGCIRMFISWLRPIINTTTFRSYKRLLSILLRVIRHCRSLINEKEGDFRERPTLALSSQPVANQPKPSLAVPLLEAPIQARGSHTGTNVQLPIPEPREDTNINVSAYDTQSPQSPAASSTPIPMPVPSIPVVIATPPPTKPGNTVDIILTPIVPEPQVKRYDRDVRVYVNYTMSSELPF